MYIQSYKSILTYVINAYYNTQMCWEPTNIKTSVQELVSYTVISTKVSIGHCTCAKHEVWILSTAVTPDKKIYIIDIIINILLLELLAMFYFILHVSTKIIYLYIGL